MTSARSLIAGHLSKFAAKFLARQTKLSVGEICFESTPRRPFKLLTLLRGVVVIAMTCSSAFAQVRFGTVLGTLVDSSGATAPGATVKLTNLGTNETRTTLSGSAGTFTFPNVSAGLYRLDVEMAGFKHFTQDKVEVQVDVTTRVDAKLQVGSLTESVVVINEAAPLQTDSASLGTTITQLAVESIPLSGRNINNMLTLVPGVVAQGGTYGNAVSNQAVWC